MEIYALDLKKKKSNDPTPTLPKEVDPNKIREFDPVDVTETGDEKDKNPPVPGESDPGKEPKRRKERSKNTTSVENSQQKSFKKRRSIMRGSKAKYSDKQKRMAKKIEAGYKKKGAGKKTAERIGWATVNKVTGGAAKKKSTSGRKKTNYSAPRRSASRSRSRA